jgi:hypothetical protein
VRKPGSFNRTQNHAEFRRYEGLGKNLGFGSGIYTDRSVEKLKT